MSAFGDIKDLFVVRLDMQLAGGSDFIVDGISRCCFNEQRTVKSDAPFLNCAIFASFQICIFITLKLIAK